MRATRTNDELRVDSIHVLYEAVQLDRVVKLFVSEMATADDLHEAVESNQPTRLALGHP